jgi:hypothetical protein
MITPHTNILETSPQKLINMVAYVLQASSYYKVSADRQKSIGNIHKSLAVYSEAIMHSSTVA